MPVSSIKESFDGGTENIFINGDVDISSSIKIGDMMGGLMVGSISYLLVVLFFIFGLLGLMQYYFQNPDRGGSSDPTSGMNLIRLALKPLLWLFGGIIFFAFIANVLEYIYSVDIYSRIKFFLEARYSDMLGNLDAAGTRYEVAKTVLLILSVTSQVVFWSIPIIFLTMTLVILGFILSILFDNNDNVSIFKKVASSFLIGVIGSLILSIYATNINRIFFANTPTIKEIGAVNSISSLNAQVLKVWIRKGFSN